MSDCTAEPTPNSNACEHCGITFSALRVSQRFCGPTCRYASRSRRSNATTTCEMCGIEFNKYRGKEAANRYCGRACQSSAKRQQPIASAIQYSNCVNCGIVITVRHQRMFCSVPCKNHALAQRQRIHPRDGTCLTCSVAFTRFSGMQKYCSATCRLTAPATRASKLRINATRRARKAGATTETFLSADIFERDNWTCQLCGTKVDRSQRVPHRKAPTLDHVIPLSRGGNHTRANVQCAHFMCNSVKGDRCSNQGEQLRLVG